jgi:hypothetical protein
MPQFQKKAVDVRKIDNFIHGKGWLKDRIIIHRQEGPGGLGAVFVQLNNYPVLIPREVECDVPKQIVQTLREAIATVTMRDEKNEEFTRDIQKYNFTVLQENVNWDDVMGNPETAAMNEGYLRAMGKWAGKEPQQEAATA